MSRRHVGTMHICTWRHAIMVSLILPRRRDRFQLLCLHSAFRGLAADADGTAALYLTYWRLAAMRVKQRIRSTIRSFSYKSIWKRCLFLLDLLSWRLCLALFRFYALDFFIAEASAARRAGECFGQDVMGQHFDERCNSRHTHAQHDDDFRALRAWPSRRTLLMINFIIFAWFTLYRSTFGADDSIIIICQRRYGQHFSHYFWPEIFRFWLLCLCRDISLWPHFSCAKSYFSPRAARICILSLFMSHYSLRLCCKPFQSMTTLALLLLSMRLRFKMRL